MNRDEFLKNYWNYYLILENKLLHTIQYVDICKDNENTYSLEYVNLILLFGSEFDTLCKIYFELTNKKSVTMNDYKENIIENVPDIITQDILFLHNNEIIRPFLSLTDKQSKLEWWVNYNDIKHNRNINLKKANQKNALTLLSAVFCMENYLLKKITKDIDEFDIPETASNLFQMYNWDTKYSLDLSKRIYCKKEDDGESLIFDFDKK